MKNVTQNLLAGLLMTALGVGCSRPVAYFQPTQHEHFATTPAVSAIADESPTNRPAEPLTTAPAPTDQIGQAQAALNQVDALVRNDNQLASDRTVQKRLNRVRTLLASAKAATPSAVTTTKKASLMERFMLKKMDKKINRQLAPNQPDKAMISSGTLATGAVLVIVGLLLLLLTTGTAATVGVIALIAGAVVLLLGLIA